MNRFLTRLYVIRLLLFFAVLSAALLSGCASEPPPVYSDSTYDYSDTPRYRSKSHRSRHKNRHHKQYYSHATKRAYRVRGKTYYPMASAKGYSETGLASWYGAESGSKTAMGTHFSPGGITAAHKTLPLPSKVRVTNLRNGRSVVVLVNDRGPFKPNRIIDLSQGAARRIGMDGLAKVKVDYLGGVD